MNLVYMYMIPFFQFTVFCVSSHVFSFNAENLFLDHKDCDLFIETLLQAGEVSILLYRV